LNKRKLLVAWHLAFTWVMTENRGWRNTYHHLFRTDKTAINTIKELGLGDRLTWSHPRTVTLTGGQIHQLDSPFNLLLFPPLRIDERLRVFAVLAILKLTNAKPFEGKTADAWLRRWMGQRPYQMLFEPLFEGKFGALREQIAMPWFWARVHDRTTYLGYLRGGFQLVYERLVEKITGAGGKVLPRYAGRESRASRERSLASSDQPGRLDG